MSGNLTGRDRVVVKEGADISGNITSPSVSLHESAKFNGSIDMSGQDAPADKRPEKPAETVKASQNNGVPANDANAAEKKAKAETKSSADAA